VAPRILGSTVGGLIVLLNARTLLDGDWVDLPGAIGTSVYVVLCALWAAALAYSVRAHRQEKAREAEHARQRQPVSA
jgi:hypothetical protein